MGIRGRKRKKTDDSAEDRKLSVEEIIEDEGVNSASGMPAGTRGVAEADEDARDEQEGRYTVEDIAIAMHRSYCIAVRQRLYDHLPVDVQRAIWPDLAIWERLQEEEKEFWIHRAKEFLNL